MINQNDKTWEALDRLDWHLWILAALMIFVLGISLLGFMLPTVFWTESGLEALSSQRAFFSFCVLLALVLVYLLQRQAKIRVLKRELFEAHAAVGAAQQETAIQVFHALAGTLQFRDTLAMEYRRASSSGTPLAIVLFQSPRSSLDILGQLAMAIRHLLRRGETLCRVFDRAIAVILPGMHLRDAVSFAAQVEGLSGIQKDGLEVKIAAYPEEATSLAELEQRLGKFVAHPEHSAREVASIDAPASSLPVNADPLWMNHETKLSGI